MENVVDFQKQYQAIYKLEQGRWESVRMAAKQCAEYRYYKRN